MSCLTRIRAVDHGHNHKGEIFDCHTPSESLNSHILPYNKDERKNEVECRCDKHENHWPESYSHAGQPPLLQIILTKEVNRWHHDSDIDLRKTTNLRVLANCYKNSLSKYHRYKAERNEECSHNNSTSVEIYST